MLQPAWFVIACAFVVLLIVALPRRDVASPTLALLRCILPAWRFFEEMAAAPELSHRVMLPGCEPGPWLRSLPVLRRTPAMLWLNAAGNLYLAQQSLVEHLAADLEDCSPSDDPAQCVSYRLVQMLVLERIRSQGQLSLCSGLYQFRLSELNTEHATLFESACHSLECA
jgi:hypothetical protein